MSVASNSYSSAADVASLSHVWTNAGVFDANTQPTITEVEGYINQISSLLNVALAGEGFTIPITQDDAKLACSNLVSQLSSDMVAAANSTGRFFTERSLEGAHSITAQIRKEIGEWVDDQAEGLQAIGAARSSSLLGQIATREADNSGNEVTAIFQRGAFGNDFPNWDK